jgi:hypothetical protein
MAFGALFMGFKGKISKGGYCVGNTQFFIIAGRIGYLLGNTQFALLEIKLYAV